MEKRLEIDLRSFFASNVTAATILPPTLLPTIARLEVIIIRITLYSLYKKAGANVVLHWEENSGHELGYDEIPAAKGWLVKTPRE